MHLEICQLEHPMNNAEPASSNPLSDGESQQNGSQGVSSGTDGDVQALEFEIDQLRDRALRTAADSENTRLRGERAVKDASEYAISAFAREILSVSDNLHRAIVAAVDGKAAVSGRNVVDEGVRATERQLASVLQRFGVQKIEAIGARFNPHLHEAVMETMETPAAAGIVVQVLEDGYTIHARLLRPASVVISAARPKALSSGDTRDDRSV
jgi:molecular chaperone GrpE